MLTVASSRELRLELFPFISLFLCVIGVLAFLQNLLVMGYIGASEEEALQPQIFQTAYLIECHPDKLILRPPSDALDTLFGMLNIEQRSGLDIIRARRANNDTAVLPFDPEFDEDQLRTSLNEVVTINKLSATHRFPYEEYLLFDIRSGGSDAYHYLQRLLDTPEYRHLRSGLDITDFSAATIGSSDSLATTGER